MRKSFAGLFAAVPVAAAALCPPPGAAAESPPCLPSGVCAFYSPSQNISCEMTYRYYDAPDSAYCQWVEGSTGYSVTLHPDGTFESCIRGSCLGNPGEGTPTLPAGQSAAIGPFVCVSQTETVSCTAAPSGRGFTLSGRGIATAG